MNRSHGAAWLALALVAGLTSFAGNAKAALTYTWSFDGAFGGGTVQGTLTVNGSGAASEIYITQIAGSNTSVPNTNFALNASSNQFTVTGAPGFEVITSADFASSARGPGLYFNHFDGGMYFSTYYADETFSVYSAVDSAPYESSFSAITFTLSAVPEPSSLGLLALGAGGLLARRRRKA
jgi:hypothetical protein